MDTIEFELRRKRWRGDFSYGSSSHDSQSILFVVIL